MKQTRSPWLGAVSLVALTAIAYGTAILPGVDVGDTGEFQWAGPLLGICHSPGYALQITALHLFTRLPIGGTLAWRANVMSAVFGVAGVLALYLAAHRITCQVIPAWVAGATLAFSSVYFRYSLMAEAYVFGATFLLIAVYALVRLAEDGRSRWLFAAALSLGIAVAERPSELLLVPVFAAAAWSLLPKGHAIDWKRSGVAAAILMLPFALAVLLDVQRAKPDRAASADEVLRQTIPGLDLSGEVTYDYRRDRPPLEELVYAARFASGQLWSNRLSPQNIPHNLSKYLWLVCGLGAFGRQFAPAGDLDPMLRGGASIALPGVLLALAGAVRWRKVRGYVLLAAGLIGANLVFVLPYFAFDTLTFTIPGLIGWSVLVGLGSAAVRPGVRPAILLLPVGLLILNYRAVDQNTPQTRLEVAAREAQGRAPWPQGSAIVSTYWPAMSLRYMLRVEAPRPDVAVIHVPPNQHPQAEYQLSRLGRRVFVTQGIFPAALETRLLRSTPPELARVGVLEFDAEALRR